MIHKDCILCESSDYNVLYPASQTGTVQDERLYRCTSTSHGRFSQVVKCNKCGLVYLNPRRPDADILNDYTQVVDDKYLAEKKYRILTFNKSLGLIKKYKRHGEILDIGCYIGTFLEAARDEGWETFGIEPSRWAVSYARERLKLNILHGTARECAHFSTAFDVITLWDTIEHLADPVEDLKCASSFLKDEGLLFLSTMNVNSLPVRLLGKRWPWFMDMHLYYFQPETMKKLLEKANLKVIAISKYTHVVSLDYLAYKVSAYSKKISECLVKMLKMAKMGSLPINVDLGDFMTVVAKKA